MKDQVYKLIELTGTSTKSIEDAVNTALRHAGKTIKKPELVSNCRNAREHRAGPGSTLAGHHQGRLRRHVILGGVMTRGCAMSEATPGTLVSVYHAPEHGVALCVPISLTALVLNKSEAVAGDRE